MANETQERISGETAEKARLVIHKGVEGELDLAGLKFVACRREIEKVDGGVTLYVRGRAGNEDHDLVRFDFFRKRPHFHVPAENQAETKIDGARFGDGLEWGIDQITTRMKSLVEQAGFDQIAAEIDSAALAAGSSQLRGLVAGLAEPSETSYFEVDRAVIAGLLEED